MENELKFNKNIEDEQNCVPKPKNQSYHGRGRSGKVRNVLTESQKSLMTQNSRRIDNPNCIAGSGEVAVISADSLKISKNMREYRKINVCQKWSGVSGEAQEKCATFSWPP